MAPFWERAAHSVNRMFSVLCLFVILVVSHFGCGSRALVLIAQVPGHCLPFTFVIYFQLPVHRRVETMALVLLTTRVDVKQDIKADSVN